MLGSWGFLARLTASPSSGVQSVLCFVSVQVSNDARGSTGAGSRSVPEEPHLETHMPKDTFQSIDAAIR